MAGMRWIFRHPQPVVILVGLAGAGLGVGLFATRSEAFRIAEIESSANSALHIPPSLIGQNLWTVDLESLAEQLHAQRPEVRSVRVIRSLPNRLRVEVVERTPLAQLKLGQWHAVDLEGFIFAQDHAAPLDWLIMIKGAESQKVPLKTGKVNESERLALALRVVARLQEPPALGRHKAMAVDVSDPQHVVFTIDGETEVRCGSEAELPTALYRLRAALERIDKQSLEARYIDVRFKDPVIGPRT